MSGKSVGMTERIAAITSLAATSVLVLLVFILLVSHLPALLLGLLGVAITVAGGWAIITERMPRRALGFVAAIVGIALIIVAAAWASDSAQAAAGRVLAFVILGSIAGLLARYALAEELHALASGVALFTPTKPVLIYNEKSGGGKVGKFGLLDVARELGVEIVGLHPGDDLEQLARDAVARGADCLGMAGGDGSQALVASVAVELGLPFVCIPAGTRNHFALDLGLDRDDPRKAMPAFKQGALRTIDYATVGDRLFVNNVSLGVYATIVQQDEYRDAKLTTSRNLLPDLVGRTADRFDLQFTTPSGEYVDDVFVVLVSNNPYVIGPSLSSSQRPSLTTGKLGVVAARARTGADAVSVLADATLHLNREGRGLIQFQAPVFEVHSESGHVYAGVDGEALRLETPLTFRIQPAGLTLLVTPDKAAGPVQDKARALNIRALLNVAAGRPAT
jgi:diacylglycerol kinase family enzyme